MKKLFAEKPLIHYTFVLTIVALVCGLVIGGVNAITAPIIEQNIYRAKLKAYQEVVPELVSFQEVDLVSGAPRTLLSKVEVFDKELDDPEKTTIAFIYEVFKRNEYGPIRFVVSLNSQGVILGASFIILEQTYGTNLTEHNLQRFIGLNISTLAPLTDIRTGATGSLNTVKEMFADVAIEFAQSQPEPEFESEIDQLYQAFTTVSDDASFASQTTDTVLSRQVVSNTNSGATLGYIYKLSGSTQYQQGGSVASIALYVYVDNDNVILVIKAPTNEYNHTLGSFYTATISFLDSFVGVNIFDAPSTGSDIIAGATDRTKNLIVDLLEDLKEVILP